MTPRYLSGGVLLNRSAGEGSSNWVQTSNPSLQSLKSEMKQEPELGSEKPLIWLGAQPFVQLEVGGRREGAKQS